MENTGRSFVTSPPPPEFNDDPLIFKPEWLSPAVNDIHSRSRTQCLMLTYLRLAQSHLTDDNITANRLENPLWSKYFESLKIITSLDVCQPPPIRRALARLWLAYVHSAPGNHLVIPTASWFLEQLRTLNSSKNIPGQAAVFADCAALFFTDYQQTLIPFLNDYALNIIKFCESSSNSIACVASQGLNLLTKQGCSWISTSVRDATIKMLINLTNSQSAKLRTNAMQTLINIQDQIWNLGMIVRKNLKNRVEELLLSRIGEEMGTAAELLALLTVHDGSGVKQKQDKIVYSWVKLADRQNENPKGTAKVFSHIILILGDADSLIKSLLGTYNLSLAIVIESKRRQWSISVRHLKFILQNLETFISSKDLFKLATFLLQLKDISPPMRLVFVEFYIDFLSKGTAHLTDNDLCRLPSVVSFSIESAYRISQYLSKDIAFNDSGLRFKLILSIFAQMKEEWSFVLAEQSKSPSELFLYLSICLSALLNNVPFNSNSESELIQQISSWLLEVFNHPSSHSMSQAASLALMGALSKFDSSTIFIKRIFYESSTSIENVIDIFGPLSYIINGSSHHSSATTMEGIDNYLGRLWKSLGIINDISKVDSFLLCSISSVTVTLIDNLNASLELAAMTASRIICNYENLSFDDFLTINCVRILSKYLSNAPIASIKYHFAQFNIYTRQSSSTKSIVFLAVSEILKGIELAHGNEKDATFLLEILKDIVFPFICDGDGKLQDAAVTSLGILVKKNATVDFRDAVLQELFERSLNEQDEVHRRGYIMGIGQVLATGTHNGLQMDSAPVIGLLSSLAKDPRSLIVQRAAFDALHSILKSSCNRIDPVIITDTIYLVWQVYMQDANSIPITSALDNCLFEAISRVTLVLMELLGPDLRSSSTVARICKIVTSDLLDYPEKDSNQISSLIDSSLHIILVCRNFDNWKGLIDSITVVCSEGGPGLSQALSCLRWIVELQSSMIENIFSRKLLVSLCNLSAHKSSSELEYCIDVLFKGTFTRHPEQWTTLLNDLSIIREKKDFSREDSVNSVTQGMETLITTDVAAGSNQDLLNSFSAIKIPVEHVMNWIKNNGKDILDIWKEETCNTFLNDLVRISLSFVMVPRKVRWSRDFKLIGLGIVGTLISSCYEVRDLLDEEASILDSYQSQLVTILSTASNEEDLIISRRAFCVTLDIMQSLPSNSSLLTHPKISQLAKRAKESLWMVKRDDDEDLPSRIELVCKLSKLDSLCDEQVQVEVLRLFVWMVDLFLDGKLSSATEIKMLPELICSLCVTNLSIEQIQFLQKTSLAMLVENTIITSTTLSALKEVVSWSPITAISKEDVEYVNFLLINGISNGHLVKVSQVLPLLSLAGSETFAMYILAQCLVNDESDENINVILQSIPKQVIVKGWPLIIHCLERMKSLESTLNLLVKVDVDEEIKSDLELLYLKRLQNIQDDFKKLHSIVNHHSVCFSDYFYQQAVECFKCCFDKDPSETGRIWISMVKSSPSSEHIKKLSTMTLDLFLHYSDGNYKLDPQKFYSLINCLAAPMVREAAVAYLSQ